MPDAQMDIKSLAAVTPQSNDTFQRQVIARNRDRNDEGLTSHRVEHLPTVGVIVQVPKQNALRILYLGVSIGRARII